MSAVLLKRGLFPCAVRPSTVVFRSLSKIGYGNADEKQAVYSDTNFPLAGGRVLHLDVGPGDVANRIMSVGDVNRAERLAKLLDDSSKTKVVKSGRGFVTYTGTFDKVPVSIIATGMGIAMMDFVVRETRAVVQGPMMIVRFGSCGGLRADVPAGTVVISQQAAMVQRNPDAFHEGSTEAPYRFLRPVSPDPILLQQLDSQLQLAVGSGAVMRGTNVTACSFYPSQGRIGSAFDDRNADLVEQMFKHYPDAATCEMETFHLLDMARVSSVLPRQPQAQAQAQGPATSPGLRAAAAAVVLANRRTNQVLDGATMSRMEAQGGRAVLAALTQTPL